MDGRERTITAEILNDAPCLIIAFVASSDPKLPLNCPACGTPLRYGTSTASGQGAYNPGDTFNTIRDVHHYECTNRACRTFWKFGPSGPMTRDPLELAAQTASLH